MKHHHVRIESGQQPRLRALRVAGTFVGRAGGSRFQKAELVCVPMTLPHEYESVVRFEVPKPAPVLVSPTQRYAILTGLVKQLRHHIPGLEFIGVRLYGSDMDVQLTPELLAADVLVTHAPLLLAQTLGAERRNIALIQQDLRADGLEEGRNECAVWLVAPTDPAVEAFLRFVEASEFLQGLQDLTVDLAAELAA
jgi:hypothetical protein